ncbi:MAG TPA: MarR family transcriptional regulator [Trueperaceae bacterium]|nr:MarR family transcriptional regulator [Trueperaceae bacterium]
MTENSERGYAPEERSVTRGEEVAIAQDGEGERAGRQAGSNAERADVLELIEQFGLLFESQGVPRMAGRILGALLVADPPEQSADQLVRTLHASRSSVSTMTRLLEGAGYLERVSKPGDRRLYYRARPDVWHQRTLESMAPLRDMRRLAEKGLRLTAGAAPEARSGLRDMYQFLAYWEQELPRMIEGWKQARRRGDLPPAPGDDTSDDGSDDEG